MKFKNIKNQARKGKSPSNSRTIPASTKVSTFDKSSADRSSGKPATFLKIYRLSLKVFIVFIFILAVIVVGLDLHANTQAKQAIDLEREKLTKDLKFWESFIAKHKDYRDAYFQASILEYKLGNTSMAKTYVEKGLSLDPNSENGKEIESFLINK